MNHFKNGDVYYEQCPGFSIGTRFFQIINVTDKTVKFQEIECFIVDHVFDDKSQISNTHKIPNLNKFKDIIFSVRKSSFEKDSDAGYIYYPKNHKVLLCELAEYIEVVNDEYYM